MTEETPSVLAGRLTARQRRALAIASLAKDVRVGTRETLMNAIGGSALMPRVGRYLLYRAGNVATRSPLMFSGSRVYGRSPVTIGERTFVNHECYFEANAPITIGADCHIAMQAMFLTSDHPFDEDGRFSFHPIWRGVTIGDRCWIGARVTVLPGVTIGDDCVVAAGSLVNADCAPGGLYAGSPARRLRDLPRRDVLIDG